jgi:hypothetical protein
MDLQRILHEKECLVQEIWNGKVAQKRNNRSINKTGAKETTVGGGIKGEASVF